MEERERREGDGGRAVDCTCCKLRRYLLSLGVVQGHQPEGCNVWCVDCNVRVDLPTEDQYEVSTLSSYHNLLTADNITPYTWDFEIRS